MKLKQQIVLSLSLLAALFGTIMYTSSSCTKDACGTVVCQHGGKCFGGTCSCPAGISGTRCETEVLKDYLNTYIGTGVNDSGIQFYNSTAKIAAVADTDYKHFTIDWKDSTGHERYLFYATLDSPATANGSSFSVDSFSDPKSGRGFAGKGLVSANSLTVNMKVYYPDTTIHYMTLPNFVRQ